MASEVKSTPPSAGRVMLDRRGFIYEPTVGPKLRLVLISLFVLFAILAANSVYLLSLKALNAVTGKEHSDWFYYYMFLAHLVFGLLMIVPFVVFAGLHLRVALGRPNRKAVRWGLGLLISGVILIVTGVLMIYQRQLFPTTSITGQAVYWLHALAPVAIIVCYVLHRLAGPRIQWGYARIWGGVVVLLVAGFGYLHFQDPREWGVQGAGEDYFFPSSARTLGGQGGTPYVPAHVMMSDSYCLNCHADAYAGWFHSAHHFSSFNNLAYRQSILDMRKALDREARRIAHEKGLSEGTEEFTRLRDRKLQATRWCAGCHDPVPFFTGVFNDDQFFADLEVKLPGPGQVWKDESIQKQPTAHAGLTCVSCHGITHVNSVMGNGDYVFQEPPAYPFQYSDNPWLLEVNKYLVKAKPDLHKRSMLKPFHRTSEFCQVCHKVSLPPEVNDYKWVRGQNHYDSWHNSGASGFAARSFQHPAVAKKCSDCHMPLMDSKDFGGINGQIHNHLFLGANTALPKLRQYFGERNYYPPIGDEDDVIRHHQEFLRDKKMRVDLFALRAKGEVDGELRAIDQPLPTLAPGETYLLEVVVRNQGVGHEFTQGTADSNEVWLHVSAASQDRVWAESGALDAHGYLDASSHYLNALILDRKGRRIDRRNAKDIFVPLYNKQVPPSGSQVVHYRLTVPPDQKDPVRLSVRLNYRKFDRIYQDFFMNERRAPQAAALLSGLGPTFGSLAWGSAYQTHAQLELPITTIAEDVVTLAVQGGASAAQAERKQPALWERFNDYGVGLFLQGNEGAERGLLRQAEEAFQEVTRLKPDYADGYVNLARVYLQEGRLADAAKVLDKAWETQPGYFKTAWLRGELNRRNNRLDEAIADFRAVLATKIPEKKFDFAKDREIRRTLAETLYQRAQREPDESAEQRRIIEEAIGEFHEVLAIDPEDRQAHFMLDKCHRQLGEVAKADEHLDRYRIYQVDNNARDDALRIYRLAHPWADHAAQSVVIYDLKHRVPPTPSAAPSSAAGGQ